MAKITTEIKANQERELEITHATHVLGAKVIANIDGQLAGYMELTGEWLHLDGGRFVNVIKVLEEYQRQGVATALWEYAQFVGLKPHHDLNKTEAGKAWAATVGDN